MTQALDKDGYCIIGLRRPDMNKKTFRVHRLVADAFIPNPNNYDQVNHKDENPSNNHFKNLEWCTSQYNNSYGTRNIRILNTKRKRSSYGACIPVNQYTLDGDFIKTWESARDVGRSLGISSNVVRKCCVGELKRCYNFIWKYAKNDDTNHE